MNTVAETAITTPARRIARDTNETPGIMRTWYDARGHVVERKPANRNRLDSTDRPEGGVVFTVGRRSRTALTQREAQDLLDAEASEMRNADYLDEVAAERELGRRA